MIQRNMIRKVTIFVESIYVFFFIWLIDLFVTFPWNWKILSLVKLGKNIKKKLKIAQILGCILIYINVEGSTIS